MTRTPRVVLDTNVVVSAFLWEGKPGQLLAIAGEGGIRLFSSRVLQEEARATLDKPRLARAVAMTGLSAARIMADYRRLTTVVRTALLETRFSRDPDDDHVIACAIAARADYIVTGDDDLLVLGAVAGIAIRSVSNALAEIA